jgi:leucyl-tRNA synthetase
MSKSKGNVVNPDEIVGQYGADAVRLYEMFMGPFEDGQPWDPKGVVGTERFLKRFFEYVMSSESQETPKGLQVAIHGAIKKVGEDIKDFKFNTAISALMVLLNAIEKTPLAKDDLQTIVKLLHPFAPHMAQELWEKLGNKTFLDFESWPAYDPTLTVSETVELVVQVNGKLRGTIAVSREVKREEAERLAYALETVKAQLNGKAAKKIIFVPGKLINFVA